MDSGAIEAMTFSSTLPADSPRNTSAPASASPGPPLSPRGLVRAARSALTPVRSPRSAETTPLESRTTTSEMPAASSMFAHATPAAPAPETTTRSPARSRPCTRAAPVSAARTTMAVPCWSSCITGQSSASTTRRSTSKHRGAEMSSRLTAPKLCRIRTIVSTISSTSWVSSTIGMESRPANFLNSAALPSITGNDARGPISPRPSTAEPSEMTATSRSVQV